MLQQTQVRTVIPYWERWLRELPDVAALATAPEQRVLKLWEGLGYYTRARNLQKAAQQIMRDHAGQFPCDFEAILALPGVGRYTAGAIASIAFNQPTSILDGNVIRVLTRLFAIAGNPRDKATNERLWQLADQLVQVASSIQHPASNIQHLVFAGSCSVLNQSLMELGATVCTPANPRCDACPLASLCRSRAAGSQSIVPPPKPATTRRALVLHALVPLRGARVGLAIRPEGLWKGLLAPPLVEAPEAAAATALARVARAIRVSQAVACFDFQTTHRSIRFVVHRAAFPVSAGLRWVPLAELDREAVSAAALRAVRAASQGTA